MGVLLTPESVEEAAQQLANNPEARLISGGATLVAMMNAGLISPEVLISLSAIEEIRGIRVLTDGRIRIGAFTRHRETAACEVLDGNLAVLRHAASKIANPTVRNMGTIGGSISFADPGLDYPPALVCVDATVEVASTEGRRVIRAQDFFLDWYTTALRKGEMVTAIELPPARAGTGVYYKHARVSGDFAIVSLALSLSHHQRSGKRIRAVVGACGPKPLMVEEANALLESASTVTRSQAGELLQSIADPMDDVRGTAIYRRALIPRLLEAGVEELTTGI